MNHRLFLFFLALFCAALLSAAEKEESTPLPAASPVSEPQAAEYKDPVLKAIEQILDKGDWREARAKAAEYLAHHQKSAEAWVLLGRTYVPGLKYKKAVRRFEKALKHDPSYAPAYYWKGRVFEEWGKPDEAANEYQAALRADPRMDKAQSAWNRLKDASSVSTP
jgi:Tfp pilus assembly protein PilF